MDAIGLSLSDVIERCRSNVASRHLLHHTAPVGNAPLGSNIHKDTISRAFADARRKTDLSWPGKNPPTYHEIRSLAERIYKAQGIDTQALLGHRHARMTEVYNDARQAEWTTVRG
jgi:integrase